MSTNRKMTEDEIFEAWYNRRPTMPPEPKPDVTDGFAELLRQHTEVIEAITRCTPGHLYREMLKEMAQ